MKECSITLKQLQDNFDDVGYYHLDDKTHICVLLSYPNKVLKNKVGYGRLALYSQGIDYHNVFKEKLSKICRDEYKYYYDSDEFDERDVALKAGLGFIGKNNLLINSKYGSFTYIALIVIDSIVDFDIEVTKNINRCDTCDICETHCPTKALKDYKLDTNKCLSSITQTKKVFNENGIKLVKNNIWGCDICQLVCPLNKEIEIGNNIFEPNNYLINIEELFSITNKQFKLKYGNKACAYKGKLVMLRNAICVAFNQNLISLIPLIKESLDKGYPEWYNQTAINILELFKQRKS